jgi:hypothetical protein
VPPPPSCPCPCPRHRRRSPAQTHQDAARSSGTRRPRTWASTPSSRKCVSSSSSFPACSGLRPGWRGRIRAQALGTGSQRTRPYAPHRLDPATPRGVRGPPSLARSRAPRRAERSSPRPGHQLPGAQQVAQPDGMCDVGGSGQRADLQDAGAEGQHREVHHGGVDSSGARTSTPRSSRPWQVRGARGGAVLQAHTGDAVLKPAGDADFVKVSCSSGSAPSRRAARPGVRRRRQGQGGAEAGGGRAELMTSGRVCYQ